MLNTKTNVAIFSDTILAAILNFQIAAIFWLDGLHEFSNDPHLFILQKIQLFQLPPNMSNMLEK